MTALVKLPFPPTTNNLFRNIKGGRTKTVRYRTWLSAAGWQLQSCKPVSFPGRVALDITLGKPDRRRRDLSNYVKAIEDLLVKHEVIRDDSLVMSLKVAWAEIDGAVIEIRDLEAEAAEQAA